MRGQTVETTMRIVGILALSLALFGSIAAAGACGGGCGGGHEDLGRALASLQLSDEQQQRVDKLLQEAQGERPAHHKEILRLRHELRGKLLEDKPDRGQIRKLAEKIAELEARARLEHIELGLDVREILTPEQQDLLLLKKHGGMAAGFGCGGSLICCCCAGACATGAGGCCSQAMQCCHAGGKCCQAEGKGCHAGGRSCHAGGKGCPAAGHGCLAAHGASGCGHAASADTEAAAGGHGCQATQPERSAETGCPHHAAPAQGCSYGKTH